MELYHEIREKAFILILAGNLDGYNSGEIAHLLKKAFKSHKENILIDCRNLTSVSSSGVGIFLSQLPHIKENNIQMIFFGMSTGVKKVFSYLGLDSVLNIKDQLPEQWCDPAIS